MRPEDLGIGRLFEKVRDAVIVADAKSQRVILWNPAATDIFGYSLPEALDLRVEALVPGNLKAQHRAGMVRYDETGHGDYIDSQKLLELPALRKDGQEIRVEMSLNPIVAVGDSGGRFVLAIIRDITERKRSEEALREAEELFRSVFYNASVGVAVVGVDGRFLRVNPTLCEILGYSEEGLLATTFREITHPEDLDTSLDHVRRLLEGEVDKYSLEKRYIDAGGEPVWASLNVSLARDPEGNPLYFVDQIQDITERKQNEEEIRHLNETLERRVVERTAQLAERESRLRQLLGKLVVAQEEERRRVAYEVHDGLAQMIVAVQQHLQAFAKQYPPDSTEGRERLAWTLDLARQTVDETRRVIGGLRPTALDDYGLATAVRRRR